MPPITLVCCVYKERDLLVRLLEKSTECYDEAVIVHDGPDTANVREVANRFNARFFEQPRLGSLESQSPFAWAQASNDWIFRPDADEFPSDELKSWLKAFRKSPIPPDEVSGYTCVWPLWSGERTLTKNWPSGRIFLFNRQRVRFFGLVEQTPIADGYYEPTRLILHHQPRRKSYGISNLIVRKQAYVWRSMIAKGLLGSPKELPTWRWEGSEWPKYWNDLRDRPIRAGVERLTIGTLRGLRDQWRAERKIFPLAALSGGLHHALIGIELWRKRGRNKVAAHKS